MPFDNETSVEVCKLERNNRGDYIIVQKILDQNSGELKSIDIRQYFTNNDDEIIPTKKGLRIPNQLINQLKESLNSIEV